MVVSIDRALIYRCIECEEISSFPLRIFNIFYAQTAEFPCECGESKLLVTKIAEDKYTVELPCYLCGQVHKYDVSFGNMWFKPILIFKCDFSGVRIGGICNPKLADNVIDSLEEDYDDIDEDLTDIVPEENKYLISALNIIHDFAVKNEVYCTCGSHDIRFDLKNDAVVLKCGACGKLYEIAAAKKSDLDELAARGKIVLDEQLVQPRKKAKILEFIFRK